MAEQWENIDDDVIVGPEIEIPGVVPTQVRDMGIAMTASLVICKINQEHPEYVANARLIAAASELLESIQGYKSLVRSAQDLLTNYLKPDGADADETVVALLALLDGPEQRAIEEPAHAVLAKLEKTDG